MSHQPLPKNQLIKPHGTKVISTGILIVEAAIATLVFGVFAASSPKLLTSQPVAPRAAAAQPVLSPQNQMLSNHWPLNLNSKISVPDSY